MLRKHSWPVLIFFSEFVYMAIELIGSRIMSPVFGTTLDVWSAIIGTILASSAVGNYLAGKVSDDAEKRKIWLLRCFVSCGIWLVLVPIMFDTIAAFVATWQTIVALMFVCCFLFVIPGVCMGALSPIVLAQYADEQGLQTGAAASGFYTAMTLGGLFGTFLTGFVLVPFFGTQTLVIIMSFVLLILTIVSTIFLGEIKNKDAIGAVVMFVVITTVVGFALNIDTNLNHLDVWRDTKYGRVHVYEMTYFGEDVCVLNVSGGFESAMYLDESKSVDLVFDYTRKVADIIGENATSDSVILCLGGGAYSVPKWLATNIGANVTVVEIDDGVTDIAKEFFGLSAYLEDGRIENFNMDGRVFLNKLDDSKYDIVFNDTFAGEEPTRVLSTIEAVKLVHGALAENGLYISNVIGSFDNASDEFLGWEIKTLSAEFAYIYVYKVDENSNSEDIQNWVVVATDSDSFVFDEASIQIDTSSSQILTDDYAPVEALSAKMHING